MSIGAQYIYIYLYFYGKIEPSEAYANLQNVLAFETAAKIKNREHKKLILAQRETNEWTRICDLEHDLKILLH